MATPMSSKLLEAFRSVGAQVKALSSSITGKLSKSDADAAYLAKTGKAASASVADKATADGDGNVIKTHYATKNEVNNKLDASANAVSASKWATARTITLGGDASGSVTIDGSENKTLTVTVNDDSHNHVISNVDGLQSALDAKASKTEVETATSTAKSYTDTKVANLVNSAPETLDTLGELAAALQENEEVTTALNKAIGDKANASEVVKLSGNQTIAGTKTFSSTISGSVSGNAGTATKLASAKTITLDGDATGSVSFDGSENKTLTVTVKDDSHNHVIANVDGLQAALDDKADKENSIFFIEGTGTEAGVWLGTHTEITEYFQGLTIAYKLGIAGISGGSTLNINNLGAVSVVRNNGSAVTTHYGVGSILVLTYDIGSDTGTAYWKLADYDSDTKTRSSNLTGKKMYVIGAQTQSTSGQTTYSNSGVYIGTDNLLYSGSKKVATEADLRFYGSIIPLGTQITASESAPKDLNTIDYLKVGNYYCSQTAQAAHISNTPQAGAFMMQVLSPLTTTVDDETTAGWCYRLRRFIQYQGTEYIQYCNTSGTAGVWKYGPWKKVIKSDDLGSLASKSSVGATELASQIKLGRIV